MNGLTGVGTAAATSAIGKTDALGQALDFESAARLAFGRKLDSEAGQRLLRQAVNGELPMPANVVLVDPASLNGASGAYSPDGGGTVYLSAKLMGSPDALLRTYLHELGHHLDSAHGLGGADSIGDEGGVFATALLGAPDPLAQPGLGQDGAQQIAALRAENDRGVIVVNGQRIAVEFAGNVDRNDAGPGYGGSAEGRASGGSSSATSASNSNDNAGRASDDKPSRSDKPANNPDDGLRGGNASASGTGGSSPSASASAGSADRADIEAGTGNVADRNAPGYNDTGNRGTASEATPSTAARVSYADEYYQPAPSSSPSASGPSSVAAVIEEDRAGARISRGVEGPAPASASVADGRGAPSDGPRGTVVEEAAADRIGGRISRGGVDAARAEVDAAAREVKQAERAVDRAERDLRSANNRNDVDGWAVSRAERQVEAAKAELKEARQEQREAQAGLDAATEREPIAPKPGFSTVGASPEPPSVTTQAELATTVARQNVEAQVERFVEQGYRESVAVGFVAARADGYKGDIEDYASAAIAGVSDKDATVAAASPYASGFGPDTAALRRNEQLREAEALPEGSAEKAVAQATALGEYLGTTPEGDYLAGVYNDMIDEIVADPAPRPETTAQQLNTVVGLMANDAYAQQRAETGLATRAQLARHEEEPGRTFTWSEAAGYVTAGTAGGLAAASQNVSGRTIQEVKNQLGTTGTRNLVQSTTGRSFAELAEGLNPNRPIGVALGHLDFRPGGKMVGMLTEALPTVERLSAAGKVVGYGAGPAIGAAQGLAQPGTPTERVTGAIVEALKAADNTVVAGVAGFAVGAPTTLLGGGPVGPVVGAGAGLGADATYSNVEIGGMNPNEQFDAMIDRAEPVIEAAVETGAGALDAYGRAQVNRANALTELFGFDGPDDKK